MEELLFSPCLYLPPQAHAARDTRCRCCAAAAPCTHWRPRPRPRRTSHCGMPVLARTQDIAAACVYPYRASSVFPWRIAQHAKHIASSFQAKTVEDTNIFGSRLTSHLLASKVVRSQRTVSRTISTVDVASVAGSRASGRFPIGSCVRYRNHRTCGGQLKLV